MLVRISLVFVLELIKVVKFQLLAIETVLVLKEETKYKKVGLKIDQTIFLVWFAENIHANVVEGLEYTWKCHKKWALEFIRWSGQVQPTVTWLNEFNPISSKCCCPFPFMWCVLLKNFPAFAFKLLSWSGIHTLFANLLKTIPFYLLI